MACCVLIAYLVSRALGPLRRGTRSRVTARSRSFRSDPSVPQRGPRALDTFSVNGIQLCIPLAIGMATAATTPVATAVATHIRIRWDVHALDRS